MPKKLNKKEKSLYDENGRWVEERGRIKGAMRRSFRLSPQMKEVLQAARVELPPKTLKDGSVGKKNQVRYRCAHCEGLFSQKNVQVDHIEPVVPLWKKEEKMTYDELARGIFCKISNLQVLCSTKSKDLPKGQKSCHSWKSTKENFFRDRWNDFAIDQEMDNGFHLNPENEFDKEFINKRNIEFEKLYQNHLQKQRRELEEKEERKRLREQKKLLKTNKK
jgi:hypothetical protein